MDKNKLIKHLELLTNYLKDNYELNNENKKDINTMYARGKSIAYWTILENIKDGIYDYE